MFRITVSEDGSEQRWILQGRLVEPWVGDVEAKWRERNRRDTCRYVVDLTEVTLIDKSGEKLLRAMWRAGADLIARGVYLRYLVEDIHSRCRRFGRSA